MPRRVVCPAGSVEAFAAACRYGADAYAWSRSAMTTSLGESGLPVFQAGHCSWQRPHSVHVEKSSRPFHVKSSIAPTPRRRSSGISSTSVRSTATPPAVTGASGPSAGLPFVSRRAHTLTTARNRCQETPIAGRRPTTYIHVIDRTILARAVRTTAFSTTPIDRPSSRAPIHGVRGKFARVAADVGSTKPHVLNGSVNVPSARSPFVRYQEEARTDSSPRSSSTARTTPSTTGSTTYACALFEPKNREARSPSGALPVPSGAVRAAETDEALAVPRRGRLR